MNAIFRPTPLSGSVEAISAKSLAQRFLICSALSSVESEIVCPTHSEDIEAMAQCLRELGASIKRQGESLRVTPIQKIPPRPLLDCRESGATLRFLLPVAAAIGANACFTGQGRLPERPIKPLLQALAEHGTVVTGTALPVTIRNRLLPGTYTLPTDVSSQFLSGLLLALPILAGDSLLVLDGPLVSAPFVSLTLQALRLYGLFVTSRPEGILVPGRKVYRTRQKVVVEGDWSGAAVFLAAGALGGEVTVRGLSSKSYQADRAVCDLLGRFGAKVTLSGETVTVRPGPLKGCDIDFAPCPDLLPVLAVVAACAQGESRFTNAGRLRDKESDRLASTAALLCALGGQAKVLPDGLWIQGGTLHGGEVESASDHRIVMAAALAATVCSGPVTLHGAESVRKSYPGFFEDYRSLGGFVDGI